MSTTAVSFTSTTMAVATPTVSQCVTHEIPIADAACAVPFSDDNTKAMTDCCNSADVVAYFDNCALYCVAVGQTIMDLQTCLAKKDVANAQIFCNAVNTASATNTSPTVPATASASVIVDNGDDGKGDDDKSGNGDDKGGDDKSGDDKGSGSDDKGNDAVKVGGISVMGVSIGAMLFSAFAFGGMA